MDLSHVTGEAVGDTVIVSGFSAIGDGGGGLFYWSRIGTHDGGTVVASHADCEGRPQPVGFWHRLYSGALNVRWFGAKGNGREADDLAIQTTIDALPSDRADVNAPGGGSVFLPRGIYRLTRPLVLRSGVHILGEGQATLNDGQNHEQGVTILDGARTTRSALTTTCTTNYRIAVSDLAIRNFTGDVLVLQGTYYATVENVSIIYGRRGIVLQNGTQLARIVNVNIRQMDETGLDAGLHVDCSRPEARGYADGQVTMLHVDGGSIRGSPTNISLQSVYSFRVSHVSLEGNGNLTVPGGGVGILIGGGSGTVQDVDLEGNETPLRISNKARVVVTGTGVLKGVQVNSDSEMLDIDRPPDRALP